MNRIPVFIRTPYNHISKNETINRIVSMLHLPDDIHEINLRKIFSESMGNPLKKNE